MSHLDLEKVSEMVRAARKPLFCWLQGRKGEIREFKDLARRHGIPVCRELHRTVECMVAQEGSMKTTGKACSCTGPGYASLLNP